MPESLRLMVRKGHFLVHLEETSRMLRAQAETDQRLKRVYQNSQRGFFSEAFEVSWWSLERGAAAVSISSQSEAPQGKAPEQPHAVWKDLKPRETDLSRGRGGP
jgi:hypothetical protein